MIKTLTEDNFEDFKNYCIAHRSDHDESFLYDEDLDEFIIGNNNPTYLLYREDQVVAVCSIIQDAHHLMGNKARVRIFHSSSNMLEDYEILLQSILPLNPMIHRIIMFIPEENDKSRLIVEKMGFIIERYSYVMNRSNQAITEFHFPDGFELTDFVLNRDENDYLHVRNTAFAHLKGSETPITKEQVNEQMQAGKILSGGAKILRHKGEPVGIIRIEHEYDQGKDYSFIAPLAILPEYQGKGLGSQLLRAGIKTGYDNGFKDCMLSVNAENENALKLYYKEGFKKTFEMVCYNLKIK